jgi:hypothetical protein
MKRLLLLLFAFISVMTFPQNRVINFKNGNTTEKKESSQPIRDVSENQDYIEINYHFEDADVFDIKQDTNKFELIRVNGFASIGDVGKPDLPCYNDVFVVPQKEGLKIKILETKYQEYDSFCVYPALEPQLDSEKDSTPRIKLDESTYSSNSYYPAEIVKIVSVQDYREVPLAFVQIRPIQFNPKTNKIRCYSNIKYQIIFSGGKTSKTNVKKETLEILKNTVANPKSVDNHLTSTNLLRSGSLSTTTNKNYIIITTNKFLQAAREFADWKALLGFSCEVVSQDSWTDSQVKSAIQTRYANWGMLNNSNQSQISLGWHEY